jgi:hypothetical protein
MEAAVATPATSPWSKTCACCNRTYLAGAWATLELVQTVPVSAVQRHLSVPAPWRVEVRRCACGAKLAVRSSAMGAAGADRNATGSRGRARA